MTETPNADRPAAGGGPDPAASGSPTPTTGEPAPSSAEPQSPPLPAGAPPATTPPPSTAPAAPLEPLPAGPPSPPAATDEPAGRDAPAPAARWVTPPVAGPAATVGPPVPTTDAPTAEAPFTAVPGAATTGDGSGDDGSDATAEDATEPTPPTRGRGLLVAMTLLTIAGLLATVVLAVIVYQRDRDIEREAAALAAAERLAGYLTSYDSDSIDEDFRRVTARATGEFAKDFEAESARVRPTIEQYDVTAEGIVREAAVQKLSRDGQMATVLLFIDQRVRTSASPDPRTDKNRIVMTVQRLQGEWFISRVRVL